MDQVNTTISLMNLEDEDYEGVTISVVMQGDNFSFTAELVYYNQVATD